MRDMIAVFTSRRDAIRFGSALAGCGETKESTGPDDGVPAPGSEAEAPGEAAETEAPDEAAVREKVPPKFLDLNLRSLAWGA